MGITVAVKVEHLPIANAIIAAPASEKSRTVLVPNLDYYGTVGATLNAFIRRNLFIPEDRQLLSAPLFTRLSEKDNVEDIYKRYACQADLDISELHLDEDTFMIYGREGGRFVDLVDEKRIDEYYILDRTTLHLKRLPRPLPEDGGRVFVETKDGILPLLGVSPITPVSGIKHLLEGLTGISVSQQLLSSVGRVMHDEFLIRDFDGLHKVYEDSIIDLCKSEDRNSEQAHRRMVVNVHIIGEEEFSVVVQGRDPVLSVLRTVESRTGIAVLQQKISYSGKLLQMKKTLGSYFIQPDSVLTVTISKSPVGFSKILSSTLEEQGGQEGPGQKPNAKKLKLMRTSKGHVKGTLTIPVLDTDVVSDLKRKLKRTLAPLVERNLNVTPRVTDGPFGDTMIKTPGLSPMRTIPASHFSNDFDYAKSTRERHLGSEEKKSSECRKLSFETKNAGGRSLTFSKIMNLNHNTVSPQNHHSASQSIQSTLYTPQLCLVEAFSPRGPRSGPLPSRKALDELSLSSYGTTSAKRLNFDSNAQAPAALESASELKNSSCRDLMPELLSLPDLDSKETPINVIVERKPVSQFVNENSSTGGRFSNVHSKIDNKLGAIKNIDKKAVKQWFNSNMDSLKEHIRVLADG